MIKPTILVVDDDKKFTETFVDFLRGQFNAEVVLKENSKDALEFINKERVDVLYLDIHLPQDQDGIEIVKHINKIGKNNDISIFMISKWQYNETYAKYLKDYKVDFVPKPLSLASTKVQLEELFEARGNFDYKRKKS